MFSAPLTIYRGAMAERFVRQEMLVSQQGNFTGTGVSKATPHHLPERVYDTHFEESLHHIRIDDRPENRYCHIH